MDERVQQMTLVDVSVVSIEAQRALNKDASARQVDASITTEASVESWDGTNLDISYRFAVGFKPEELFSLRLIVRALHRCTGCSDMPKEDLLKKAAEQFYPVFAIAALSIAQISQWMGFPPLMIPYGEEKFVLEVKNTE